LNAGLDGSLQQDEPRAGAVALRIAGIPGCMFEHITLISGRSQA